MERQRLEIANEWKEIDAKQACFDHSRFIATGAEHMYFEDVSLAGTKITHANLSNIEIDGAQMGGAYIHNVGVPQEGELHYNPDTAGKPVRFESCELINSTFTNCNMSNVELIDCELNGMKINGIPIEDLMREYSNQLNHD